MNVLALLRDRFSPALSSLGVDSAELPNLLGMLLPSQDAKFGDYQANFAMPLGKKFGRPPREIAQQLVAAVDLNDVCEPPEVAGPGFINLRLKNDWIVEQLAAASSDADRIGVSPARHPRTIVLDYSSPNVAKPMHVGHIRTTVIGDSLYRILKFLGHNT
ncbi:MAG: arginine--tRNA ligase, partial [Pirellulales bacterium]